ncbi:Flp pilus assembly complex ATPase component TadA, partial [Candidatus Peregrinibacteria bacterium]|nr:Flp pilus assembly complex ATPase component TadA [Candidatus Peregrinibacteria bacterium]
MPEPIYQSQAGKAGAAVMEPPVKAVPASQPQASKPLAPQAGLMQNAIIAGNIPQIVLHTISYALHTGSSDVHIEPEEKTVRVRFRIDGVLRHIVEYPLQIHPAVISRIKIMSNLKIDEQRVPQDGRTQVTTEDRRN